MRALEICPDQFVEALLTGFEHIGALALADAGVVDQQIEPFEALPRVGDEGGAIGGGGDVARENIRARLGAEALGGVAASAVGSDDAVSSGKFNGDGAPDAAARAGDDAGRLRQILRGSAK